MNELFFLFLKLDLIPGCSVEQVNERYRVLASLFHPDQMTGEKRKATAEKEMKVLNDRRDRIMAHLKGPKHKLQGACECRSPFFTGADLAAGGKPAEGSGATTGAKTTGAAGSAGSSGSAGFAGSAGSTSTTGAADRKTASPGGGTANTSNSSKSTGTAPGGTRPKHDGANSQTNSSFDGGGFPKRTSDTSKMTANAARQRILHGRFPNENKSDSSAKEASSNGDADPDPTGNTKHPIANRVHLPTVIDKTVTITLTQIAAGLALIMLAAVATIGFLYHQSKTTNLPPSQQNAINQVRQNRIKNLQTVSNQQPKLIVAKPQPYVKPEIPHPPFIQTTEELAKIDSQDMVRRTRELTVEFRQLLKQIEPPEAFDENNLAGRIPSLYKRFNYVDNQKAIFENELRRRGITEKVT